MSKKPSAEPTRAQLRAKEAKTQAQAELAATKERAITRKLRLEEQKKQRLLAVRRDLAANARTYNVAKVTILLSISLAENLTQRERDINLAKFRRAELMKEITVDSMPK